MTDLRPRTLLAHRITVFSVVCLIIFGMLPSMLEGFSTPRWTIDLAYGVPLALFLPFLKTDTPKRYAWLCFVILVYFCEGVLDAFAWPATQGLYGFVTVLLTCEIFIASMMAARWAGQQLARAHQPDA